MAHVTHAQPSADIHVVKHSLEDEDTAEDHEYVPEHVLDGDLLAQLEEDHADSKTQPAADQVRHAVPRHLRRDVREDERDAPAHRQLQEQFQQHRRLLVAERDVHHHPEEHEAPLHQEQHGRLRVVQPDSLDHERSLTARDQEEYAYVVSGFEDCLPKLR